MRAAFLISAFIASALVTSRASAELYEIPLPVTGEYMVRQGRAFEIDLGFPLAEVRDVRFRVEGTMVAPLERNLSGEWPGHPVDGRFMAYFSDGTEVRGRLNGPAAGKVTYPEPEPFAGVSAFEPGSDWELLLDGRISGQVMMR